MKNLKIICLLLGLIAGGLIGFATKPPVAVVTIPVVNLQVKTEAPQGELTNRQTQHIARSTSHSGRSSARLSDLVLASTPSAVAKDRNNGNV